MKVLHTVATVVAGVNAIAASIPGLPAPLRALAAASAVVWGGVASATGKPKGSAIGSQTEITLDPLAGEPYLIGRTYYAGKLVHQHEFGDDNKYVGCALVYSGSGPINSFESYWVDRVATTVTSGEAVGDFADFMWLDTQLGACPEASALASSEGSLPGWGSSHKLSGKAAALWTLKFDKKGKKFATGFPQLGAILEGVLGYDARLDGTYPGGSGSCRSDDETTFVYSDNPAVVGVTWALGRFQNGERVSAVGMPVTGIDMPAWVEFANACDDNGWKVGGVVSSEDDKWDVLKMICQAGGGQPIRLGGLISVDFQRPRVSLATITSGDLVGPGKVTRTKRRRERFNTVIAKYRSEEHGWEIVPADPVSIADYVALDGEARSREIPYPLVQDLDQAAELALYDIGEAREFGPISLPLFPVWVGYKPGDCLTIDVPDLLEDAQDVVVTKRSLNPETAVATLECMSETARKHTDALGATGSTVAPPDLEPGDVPSVLDWPFVQDQTLIAASGVLGLTLEADDVGGGSVTITVSDHQRAYLDKSPVDVDGDSIAGLVLDTYYGVYYDDETRAGGAVTYGATTTLADSVTSLAHPTRHHVGVVPPVSSGGTSTGGGSAPGGGSGGSGGGGGSLINPY